MQDMGRAGRVKVFENFLREIGKSMVPVLCMFSFRLLFRMRGGGGGKGRGNRRKGGKNYKAPVEWWEKEEEVEKELKQMVPFD